MELLVIIGIIAILTLIVVPNYRARDNQLALQRSANKLAQDIRRAQEMAMSASQCKTCIPPDVVPPRYGIYAATNNPDFYMLFADLNNDGLFYWPNDTSKDTIIETIYYGSKITLVSANCLDVPRARGHITFAPPDPTTQIWNGRSGGGGGAVAQLCSQDIILTLRAGASGPTLSLRINKAGLIYVQ